MHRLHRRRYPGTQQPEFPGTHLAGSLHPDGNGTQEIALLLINEQGVWVSASIIRIR